MFDNGDGSAGLPPLPRHLGWLAGELTDRLEWLCEQVPCSDTLVALEALAREPKTAAQQMLYVLAWERQVAAMQARAMAAAVAATTPLAGSGVEGAAPAAMEPVEQDLLDDELAAVLRRTERSNAYQLAFARRLHAVLPTMAKLLDAGEVTLAHARALDELTATVSEQVATVVDAEVSPRAVTATVATLRRLVRQAVAAADPDPGDRHEKAKRTAGARLVPAPDGMTTMEIRLPAADGIAALTCLNAAAQAMKLPDDPRSHGQRQVRAVLDALGISAPRAGAANAAPRPSAGRRVEVQVTIDWQALLGLRESPGELVGYGPIPAQAVRDLLADDTSVLRRLVYDPISGVLLDRAITRYTPDTALRDLLRARDVTCRYPHCTRAAIYCDIEHCTPYPDGPTSCANCGLMCRKHHNRKTRDGYHYIRPDPATGETRWTSRLGFTYTKSPATYSRDGTHPGDTTRHATSADPPPF